MRFRRDEQRLRIGLPIAAGIATLLAVPLLLPDTREIADAGQRGQPADGQPPELARPTAPDPIRAEAPPPIAVPPDLAGQVKTADAAELADLTDRLIRDGVRVSTLGVAHDLVAAGRPAVARAYLAARPDGATPATWRLRFDLARATGDPGSALALLDAASAGRTGVAAADIVAAGYAIDRPDLILRGATSGAIPPPDATLALDLARRFDRAGATASLDALDRITRADWRAADPWLALRVANRRGDTAAAMRAVQALPPADRAAAQQAVARRSGDTATLVRLTRQEAARPGADRAAFAERLLSLGDRVGAIALLKTAAAAQSPGAPAARRLVYLMGPRPDAPDLAWLRGRTLGGVDPVGWLAIYADRDVPTTALDMLERHPLGTRTETLMTRLRLARVVEDDRAGQAALALLLDGRPLSPGDLQRIAATSPPRMAPPLAAALTRRRAAAGLVTPRERMDLAWGAWNRGDAAGTARALDDYLDDRPNDVAALRLMAEAQARLGGAGAARPWLERALARTPEPGRDRIELLERLGRRGEALREVADLRAATPDDRSLAALHARLLIAQGEPGRARQVLAR